VKINPFFIFIAFLLTCIVAYSLYIFGSNDFKTIYVSVGSICCAVYFFLLIGLNFSNARKRINTKVLTSFFLLMYAIFLVYFSSNNRFLPSFIIGSSLMSTLFLGFAFFINKEKK
jgi:carbon starvation protein CstA